MEVWVADPPWAYRNVKTGGSHTSGAAQQYPVLTVAQLGALPVAQVSARDAVLALWATTPLGKDPFDVLAAWGFTFKTKWYWHKVGRKGTGYWTRGEVEEVLIGVRGDVAAWRSGLSNYLEEGSHVAALAAQTLDEVFGDRGGEEPATVLHTKPAGHSVKPEAVQDRLETLCPEATRKVELFATRHRPGWTCVGLALSPEDDVTRDAPNVWTRLGQEG